MNKADLWRWLVALAAVAASLAAPAGVDLRFSLRAGARDGQLTAAVWWLVPALRVPLRGRGRRPRRDVPGFARLIARDARLRRAMSRLVATLWRRASVHRLDVAARLGVGDPAATGMLIGFLLAAWGSGVALLRRAPPFRRAHLRLELRPDMLGAGLDVDLRCIASVRPLHIISVVPRLLAAYLSARGTSKGAARAWPTIRSRAS